MSAGELAPRALAWEQSAFWYLAGLEDASPCREGLPQFLHGPTTPEGKRFIREYVDACVAADGGPVSGCPYLPDFYREWTPA